MNRYKRELWRRMDKVEDQIAMYDPGEAPLDLYAERVAFAVGLSAASHTTIAAILLTDRRGTEFDLQRETRRKSH